MSHWFFGCGSAALCVSLFTLVWAYPLLAAAQERAAPASTERWRLGPVRLNPSLDLKNIGVDSNIFGDESDARKDFTATFGAAIDAAVQVRLAVLTSHAATDFVYFQTYKDQQSANRMASARLEGRFNRLQPFVSAEVLKTRDRAGHEIDIRARRSESEVGGGVAVRFAQGATLAISAKREAVEFAAGERFRGVDLDRTLNRTGESAAAALRLALTPVTTLVIAGEAARDRFVFSRIRDADSLRVMSGLEFSPAGVIAGAASVGYRVFETRSAGVPDFMGVVAAIEVVCTLEEDTKVDLRMDRDVTYSFEVLEPYYIATGGRAAVTRRLVGPLDLVASVSQHRLEYRSIERAFAQERGDTVKVIGGGVGYRLGDRTRVGLNAEYAKRQSDAPRGRGHVRKRLVGSLTYGF